MGNGSIRVRVMLALKYRAKSAGGSLYIEKNKGS